VINLIVFIDIKAVTLHMSRDRWWINSWWFYQVVTSSLSSLHLLVI